MGVVAASVEGPDLPAGVAGDGGEGEVDRDVVVVAGVDDQDRGRHGVGVRVEVGAVEAQAGEAGERGEAAGPRGRLDRGA